jgi:hypothetical protein
MRNYLKSFDLTDLRDLLVGGLFITIIFQVLYLVQGL